MFFNYLKEYQKTLSSKFAISLVFVVSLLFLIILIILFNPLLKAGLLSFITLIGPIGFAFLLLGLLLVTGLLCTGLWFFSTRDHQVSQSKQEVENKSNVRFNEISNLLLKEDNLDHPVKEQSIILLDSKENEEESNERENKPASTDNSIDTFAQQARDVIEMIKAASSKLTKDTQAALEVQLSGLRKRYYKLSRIYHPDLEQDEAEKAVKQGKFQELSQIYKKVQEKCDQLKKHLEQQLHPTTEFYQNQDDLLRKTSDLFREQNEILRNYNEILSKTTTVLQETNELLKAYVAMFEKHNREMDEKIKTLKTEVTMQNKKLEENEKKLKDNRNEFHRSKQEFQNELQSSKREFQNELQSLRREFQEEDVEEESIEKIEEEELSEPTTPSCTIF